MSAFSSIKIKKTINKNDDSSLLNRHFEKKGYETVHKLNNEIKNKDAKEFNEFMKAKGKSNAIEAKFFKHANNEAKQNNLEFNDIPRAVKKSTKELAKIHHLIDIPSFLERTSAGDAIRKQTLKDHMNSTIVQPKIKRFQEDEKLAKTHEDNYAQEKKDTKRDTVGDPNKGTLENIIDNTKRILGALHNYQKNLYKTTVDTNEKRHKEDLQIVNTAVQQHHDKKKNGFNLLAKQSAAQNN
jgi:hypothetical protein